MSDREVLLEVVNANEGPSTPLANVLSRSLMTLINQFMNHKALIILMNSKVIFIIL